MKEKISMLKEFFAMFREAMIVLLVLIFLIWPDTIKSKLVALGITQVNMFGMNMDLKKEFDSTANAGQKVSALKFQVDNLTHAIDSVSKSATSTEQKKVLSNLSNQTNHIYKMAGQLDNNLKQQMSRQQTALLKTTDISVPDEGWIYAGKLAENKMSWDLSDKSTIAEHKLIYEPGEILTITDDAYLRKNPDPLSHANAEVIAVIKTGEKVSYLDKDYSHSIGGGWFLWIKVKKK